MHTLGWLNERGRILRGAFQPIERVHFYRYRFRYRSRYRGLCDQAFSHKIALQKKLVFKGNCPVRTFCILLLSLVFVSNLMFLAFKFLLFLLYKYFAVLLYFEEQI